MWLVTLVLTYVLIGMVWTATIEAKAMGLIEANRDAAGRVVTMSMGAMRIDPFRVIADNRGRITWMLRALGVVAWLPMMFLTSRSFYDLSYLHTRVMDIADAAAGGDLELEIPSEEEVSSFAAAPQEALACILCELDQLTRMAHGMRIRDEDDPDEDWEELLAFYEWVAMHALTSKDGQALHAAVMGDLLLEKTETPLPFAEKWEECTPYTAAFLNASARAAQVVNDALKPPRQGP